MPDSPFPLDVARMRDTAPLLTRHLRALLHEDRLLLLWHMREGEVSVGEFAQHLGIHQPSLSQHLGVLREEGLVMTRREGKRIFYRLADLHILSLLDTLLEYLPAHASRQEEAIQG